MAQLKSTMVSGSLSVTDSTYTSILQTQILHAPTASNSTSYGAGTDGQILRTNGTSTYWGDAPASGVISITIQTSSPLSGGSATATTGTGSYTIGFANQNKNLVLAGPDNGSAATPTFRALVADDIPTISASKASLGNVSNDANLNGVTGAKGDIIYWSAADTPAHLTNTSSTTKHFLSITSQVPSWVTLSNSDVGLGDVENTKLSTWTGSSNIATVGTITTGTWNGAKLEIQYGGTGGITADAARANLGIGNGRVFYGTCETIAGTTTKQVECANFNKDTDFVAGTIVSVLFSVKNTGAVDSLKLTVGNATNGYSEAKSIKKIYYTSGVSNLNNAAEIPANGIVTFVYTGVYWQVVGLDYNTNTNTLLRTYTGNADYEYPLLAQNSAANATGQWTEYTTSYKDYYGVIPNSSTTRATINLSTGRITVPGGITTSGVTLFTNSTAATSTSTGAVRISGGLGVEGSIYGTSVYGAVWNDYAEYRQAQDQVKPGNVVIDTDQGTLRLSTKRLQPGAQVVSDTFGFAIGETDICQTPLAVSGRVLAYTYQPRENYHAGMAVCSAPNGTIDIMTREEIQKYPDAIIGIVSEIPNYESWGTGNVPINGRIWIKVR